MRIAEVTKLSPELLDDCLAQLANLLQDHCYAARRHAATMIPLLYSEWSDAQVLRLAHVIMQKCGIPARCQCTITETCS